MTATIHERLAIAVRHHQAGELPRAERIYRQILSVNPNHADALHLLGMIASQVGNQDVAIDLIRRATRIEPRNAAYFSNLGSVAQEAFDCVDITSLPRRLDVEVQLHDTQTTVFRLDNLPIEVCLCFVQRFIIQLKLKAVPHPTKLHIIRRLNLIVPITTMRAME